LFSDRKKGMRSFHISFVSTNCTSPLWNLYCCAMTRFGIKLCEKNTIIFNSDLKSVPVLSNVDHKYYQCIPKKELGVQISKRRCTVGWYKTVWYFTFVKKTDPTYIWKMNSREHIREPLYLFFHFSISYKRYWLYYQCIPKKELGVQISKRRCTVGSYKGEVEQLHPFFSVRKQSF
jgi:hypothetical protein